MSIRKKVFLAVLGLCLASVLLIAGANFIQLFKSRNDLISRQETQSKTLRESNVSALIKNSQDNALTLAQSQSRIIMAKFNDIIGDMNALKSYLEDLYKDYRVENSFYPDEKVFLEPGVKLNDVKDELSRIRSFQDISRNILKDAEYNEAAFYASESGFMLDSKDTDYSQSKDTDRRQRDWYTGAVKKKDIYWTEVYTDLITNELMVTCSMPVYKPDGSLAGVVSNDIFVKDMTSEILGESSDLIKYIFLTNDFGRFIIGSISDKSLGDFLSTEHVNQVIEKISTVNSDETGTVIGDGVMVGYGGISKTNWRLGVLLDYDKIIEPANNVGTAIETSNEETVNAINSEIKRQLFISLILAVLISALVVYISERISKSITNPIEVLEEGVKVISSGNLDYKIDLKTGDELENLANSFNKMSIDLKNYINNLEKVTKDKEKIKAELSVATTIQESMLPCVFPAFPNVKEFDIYATMDPAKEVGGDFYDFFMLDEENLAFVISDVSGKGVPGALFMVIAKTLIKDRAMTGGSVSPSAVFERVNNRLCENNGAGMFLTSFMGVLNLRTGKLTFANAGHNMPLVYRKDKDSYEWLKTKPKFVLAGFPNLKYKDEETLLNKGDKIYLYTDGVTEALNPNSELYSDQRLFDELNNQNAKNLNPKDTLVYMAKSIEKFVNGAEQSDDITMLMIEVKEVKE